MTTQAAAQQATTKPTRRQLAAQKRAEATKKAKVWLASRKDSQTPVADKLVARALALGWDETAARDELGWCIAWHTQQHFADTVASNLREKRFTSVEMAYSDALALMKERNVPAKYLQRDSQYWQSRQAA